LTPKKQVVGSLKKKEKDFFPSEVSTLFFVNKNNGNLYMYDFNL